MTSEELRDLALHALDEMKGGDITAIDISSLTTIADYMIICTGRSTRHNKALGDAVASYAKAAKVSNVHVEGESDSEWILVDLGDVIVQIMLANTRAFYSLEDLWEPVKEMREQNSKSS